MTGKSDPTPSIAPKTNTPVLWGLAGLGGLLLWVAGPPLGWFAAGFVALVPWLTLGSTAAPRVRRRIFLSAFAYHAFALQGLRHAHPLMIFPMLAMAGYLAIYPCLFVTTWRHWRNWRHAKQGWTRTLTAAEPVVGALIWVGWEWVRNHFGTGISVLMIGHTMADVPILIQIADLSGTYAVSLMVVAVNIAVFQWCHWWFARRDHVRDAASDRSSPWIGSVVGGILLSATLAYGATQLRVEPTASGAKILLVARNERTEYQIDPRRQQQIYDAYASQTVAAVKRLGDVDAVVWPESMMAGNLGWMIHEDHAIVPADLAVSDPSLTASQLAASVRDYQAAFQGRAAALQAVVTMDGQTPSLIGGCSIIDYGAVTSVYSGLVQVGPDGRVAQTYAKNHLVMFGEYIPLIGSIPVLKDLLPPGMGLNAGTQAKPIRLDGITLLPNICIETAVERIAVDHLRSWRSRATAAPEAIVTITNDAWFNGTAVVNHHLRCSQLLAAATRKPILSAANGGPTAWIDSRGIIQSQLPHDADDVILAEPDIDPRQSLYVRYGAVVPATAGFANLLIFLGIWTTRRRTKTAEPSG